MKYLHAMIRTLYPEKSIAFYTEGLGLQLWRKRDSKQGRYSLYFLGQSEHGPMIELTHNWDETEYGHGNQFGHLAFECENIYESCQKLMEMEGAILRPPRDGYMAFVKDPNRISIELLQRGAKLEPAEPWLSMKNQGSW